ncbi:MAG: 30S ribosomal protein S12 methylthiotransferase RimO [Campylobacterota bacterium]
MKQLYLASLGCTKNLIDSEVMLGKLKEYNITQDIEDADVLIVNTCGFIESAKQESIETIFELHELRKQDSILVVSGCLSQRYKDALQKELADEVDIFTGVGDYDQIDALVANKQSRFSDKVYLAQGIEDRVLTGANYHAYIKLSEGCNQQCSFCSIPGFKGKLQSRTLESVVAEVKKLASSGVYDFSFVSQDSSSYGRDLGDSELLIKLIHEVEEIAGVQSARILYLYPSTTTKSMVDAIASSTIFQTYFDIPVQHIDDKMLKKMKRGLGAAKTKELLHYMASKEGAFLRTGLIVGHPGETQESFESLYEFVQEFGFDRVSIFEYSDEEDTPAYAMDDKLSSNQIREFSKRLEDVAKVDLQTYVGKCFSAVIEGYSQEHELLLKARPLQWAYEIDGEILINDTGDRDITFEQIYDIEVTEVVGEHILAKVLWT